MSAHDCPGCSAPHADGRCCRCGRPEHDDFSGVCELCGERYNQRDPRPSVAEIGEFVLAADDLEHRGQDPHVVAHAQCGLDAGLEPA